MTLQLELLSDIVTRERSRSFSPAEEKRRHAARLLAALRCCATPSFGQRILAAFDGPAAACCMPA